MGDILKYESKDITPISEQLPRPLRKTANTAAKKINTRLVSPTYFGLFKKVCVKNQIEEIIANLRPTEVYDLKFYVLQGRLEGKIRYKILNESIEGKIGELITWRWNPCPDDITDYTMESIPGTADFLQSTVNSNFKLKDNTDLGSGSSKVSEKIKMNHSFNVSASFSKKGFAKSTLEALRQLFKNDIELNQNSTVTISYTGITGETRTKQFKILMLGKYKVSGEPKWIVKLW